MILESSEECTYHYVQKQMLLSISYRFHNLSELGYLISVCEKKGRAGEKEGKLPGNPVSVVVGKR